jgi:hypothetical protein
MAILDYDKTDVPAPHRTTEREVLAEFARDMGMTVPSLDDETGWWSFPGKVREERKRIRIWEENERNKRWGTMVRNT